MERPHTKHTGTCPAAWTGLVLRQHFHGAGGAKGRRCAAVVTATASRVMPDFKWRATTGRVMPNFKWRATTGRVMPNFRWRATAGISL